MRSLKRLNKGYDMWLLRAVTVGTTRPRLKKQMVFERNIVSKLSILPISDAWQKNMTNNFHSKFMK